LILTSYSNIFYNCSYFIIAAKGYITPNLCRLKSKRVLKPVNRTPAHNGMLNSMLRAKAVPITVTIKFARN